MTRFAHTMKILGVLATLGLCCAPPASAQTTIQVTASWTAPSAGSPVVHYVLQLSTNGGSTWSTVGSQIGGTSQVVDLEVGATYIARVAGVDAQDRQGPWSTASDPYTPTIDPGPPGQPGKPLIL